MSDNCPFCNEFNSKTVLNKSRIIFRKQGMIFIPTRGCFIEGYCLLIPEKHYAAFSYLNKKKLASLEGSILKICTIISNTYSKQVVVAEHGGDDSKYSCNSVNHAHLHFIPINEIECLLDKYMEIGGEPIKLNSFSEISKEISPYLYLRINNQNLVWRNVEKFSKQFVRRVCAELKGIGHMYDWRKHEFTEKIFQTYVNLNKEFNELK